MNAILISINVNNISVYVSFQTHGTSKIGIISMFLFLCYYTLLTHTIVYTLDHALTHTLNHTLSYTLTYTITYAPNYILTYTLNHNLTDTIICTHVHFIIISKYLNLV